MAMIAAHPFEDATHMVVQDGTPVCWTSGEDAAAIDREQRVKVHPDAQVEIRPYVYDPGPDTQEMSGVLEDPESDEVDLTPYADDTMSPDDPEDDDIVDPDLVETDESEASGESDDDKGSG